MKKQTKSKKAGSSRKATKTPATARTPKAPRTRERDPRLPAAGAILKREYKGKEIKVTVLRDGFGFERETYTSLSAIASKITGNSTNGFLFFRLLDRKPATPKTATAPKAKAKRAAPKEAASEPAPAPETATA